MAKKPKEEIDRQVIWAADLLQLGPTSTACPPSSPAASASASPSPAPS
ncbi:hypothetical protein [Arthrobacter zhaoguopingii]|nr:hypothetical protein [Arthrobacter zhaoguopingii]